MRLLICLIGCLLHRYANANIRGSVMVNKLIKVKPVGKSMGKSFIPLTEIPAPLMHAPHSPQGRRHLPEECTKKPGWVEVNDGPRIDIVGDYYDEDSAKTVATVIIPDHIDYKHFQVTTQVPYLTIGHIEAIGYHPSTVKSEHPSECEKIYQEHLEELYSDESNNYSEESLEMARMPLFPGGVPLASDEKVDNVYTDLDR